MRAMLLPRLIGMLFFYIETSTSHGGNETCLTCKHRRWPFYLASIIVAVTGMLMYFVRESHTPVLLERTVAAIRSHRPDLILRTAPTAPRPSVFRPLILFSTDPTVFLSSLANAFSTALLYLFAVAFPLFYAHYAWSGQKTTLIFLFIALGLFFSILTRFHDRHAIRKSHLSNHPLPPERTLLGLAIGAPALAVGLWWFAWTIPGSHLQTLPWPASALSLVLAGYGISEYSTTLPRYILESYPRRSNNNNKNDDHSSAFAALLVLRALLGATFPLFTGKMLQTLGNNVAGSVLAAVATAFCLVPFVAMRFGNGWRRRARVGTSGAVEDGDASDDGARSATKVVVVEEEKTPIPKAKAKKTVRFWDEDEETASSGSDGSLETMKADSELSSTETVVERGELASMERSESKEEDGGGVERSSTDDDTATDDVSSESVRAHVSEHAHAHGRASVAGLDGGELSHTATVASTSASTRTTDGIGSAGESVGNKETEKKERGKRESVRLDGVSDGYTSFLGLGLDVERLVGFPYI